MNGKFVFDTSETPVIRADGVQCVGTRWVATVTLLGSEVRSGSNEEPLAVDVPLAHLKLGWPLAKALHTVLGELIEGQEKADGEIFLPKSFRALRGPKEPKE